MKNTVKIGLLGCGTVGGGVIIVLNENKEDIARKAGCAVEVKTVLVHWIYRQSGRYFKRSGN